MGTAFGIPDRSDYGDVNLIQPGQLLDLYRQRHVARRSGSHQDIRVGNPELGLYSWATKKELPDPGGRIGLFQQPLHTHAYGGFSGHLGAGYGEGDVKLEEHGKILITRVDPQTVHFTTAHTGTPHRFALVKPKSPGDNWLLVQGKASEPLGVKKEHYKYIRPEQADEILGNLADNASVSPKLDGALTYVKLLKDRAELYSHRVSKKTGEPILYTEKFFGQNPRLDIPKSLQGAVLKGEVYGERDGKAIPSQELSGLLNATIANSLEGQKSKRVALKTLLFGLARMNNEDMKLPYSQRRKILEDAIRYLPKNKFEVAETAYGPDAGKQLFTQIQQGKHPKTHEGVVVTPEDGRPMKIKFRSETPDVYIREILPGEGRLKGTHAGGFTYSYKPDSEIVGKIGTGFSDETRKDMFEHPENYVGRVAKVEGQERFPGGALRAPSYQSLHEDYS